MLYLPTQTPKPTNAKKEKNETSTSTPEVAKRSFSDTRVLT